MRSAASALVVVVCSLAVAACDTAIVIDDPQIPQTPTTRTIGGRLSVQRSTSLVRAHVDEDVVAARPDAEGAFTLTVPRDHAIVLDVVVADESGASVVGDLAFPVARATSASASEPQDGAGVRTGIRSTSTLLPGNADLWLGDVTVATWEQSMCAAASGATGACPPVTTALATPAENPLAQNDHDDDGVADLDDPDALWLLLNADVVDAAAAADDR